METAKHAIEQLSRVADVILIQEHWYFDCQLKQLNTICEDLVGCGKATDTGDPILPVQMPRGYGGTAVIWQKSIDHLVTSLPDGANRIQCVELNSKQPMLLISVYMPCKGLKENVSDFEDCLSQLQEILNKYQHTHSIVLGGDFNESLTNSKESRRLQHFKQFLLDNGLATKPTGKTYVGPGGTDVSTIDYIFFSQDIAARVEAVEILETIHTNVSDHYPISCTLKVEMDRGTVPKVDKSLLPTRRVRWDKLDKESYKNKVAEGLVGMNDCNISTLSDLDTNLRKLNNVLVQASESSGPRQVRRRRKAKLTVWTPEIAQAVKDKKQAFYKWKDSDRPKDETNVLVINKKLATMHLRKLCRIESAKSREQSRQQILDARSSDMKLFYRLLNKQRGKLKYCVNELSVNDQVFKTESEILQGWRQHFASLATPSNDSGFDESYRQQVHHETREIIDICSSSIGQSKCDSVTVEQVKEAIKSLNRGKAPDFHGVTVEHLLYGGEDLYQVLTEFINLIFKFGEVTDALKIGALTPVYKNKGSSKDARNYRGITILPTVTKIVETILRGQIQPLIEEQQNNLQRGFTRHSSPMNCSLILEEVIREHKDLRKPLYVAFLDVKSAFDVVSHESLLRKMFHIGVDGVAWTLIHSLHQGAESVIKWNNAYSEAFEIQQGVRQGGILSTDLYKVYGNHLLDRLKLSGSGCHVGGISCMAPTCADDMAILSDRRDVLQSLINVAVDYSHMERYLLQPTKSVILEIPSGPKQNGSADVTVCMKDQPMPIVSEAMHMGILRSANTQETAVEENIRKARRTIYGLMAAGLHGENGLDPETSVHLLHIYVLPVLIYGLEVVLPKKTLVDKLEGILKKFLKQVLSLPDTTADPAIFILTGALPVEAVIHKRALTLFGSICRLDESAVEKQLARRQLSVKGFEGNSWYVAIRMLLIKYGLPDCWELIENPPTKCRWKAQVNELLNEYWSTSIKQRARLYPTLSWLNIEDFLPGKKHWLIQHTREVRDTARLKTKLKLVTGSYILQVNRACFNQTQVDPTCMLCHQGEEDMEHFLLVCSALADVRRPMLERLLGLAASLIQDPMDHSILIQLILDCSKLIDCNENNDNWSRIRALERQSISLCHTLHIERYKKLSCIPKRRR